MRATCWLGQEVMALRRGSAMAGRPLQIIGPAASYVTINAGATGNAAYTGEYPEEEDNPNKAAYFVKRLIEFCNEYDIPVDGHYHFFDYNDFLDGVDALANQGNAAWDVPESMVALEYGPIPSTRSENDTHWWNDDRADDTELFYDNDPETHPLEAETWAEWLTYWQGEDQKWNPPDYFIYDGMTTLVSYGCRIGCYADSRQITGPQNVATQFDFSAIYTDKVGPAEAKTYSEWRTEFQNAAAAFLIDPWYPHPNQCSATPCPPCEE